MRQYIENDLRILIENFDDFFFLKKDKNMIKTLCLTKVLEAIIYEFLIILLYYTL